MSKNIYIENEIFNITLHKTKNQKKWSKNIVQLHNYHFLKSWKIITSYTSY